MQVDLSRRRGVSPLLTHDVMDRHLCLLSPSIPNGRSSLSHQGMRACNIAPLFTKPALSDRRFAGELHMEWRLQTAQKFLYMVIQETTMELNLLPTSLWNSADFIDLLHISLNGPAASLISPALRTLGKTHQCRKSDWMPLPRETIYPGDIALFLPLFLSPWQRGIKVWPGVPCLKLKNECRAGSKNVIMKHLSKHSAELV